MPIWGEIVIFGVIGFIITNNLAGFDENNKLSKQLIECVRNGLKEQQRVEEWNNKHSLGIGRNILRGEY